MCVTNLRQLGTNLFAKAEFENPTGSHKVRAARHMMEAAIRDGRISPNGPRRVIEKTGGNLGLGLGYHGGRLGVQVDLVVGLSFSPTKKALLAKYGANLIGTERLKQGLQPRDVIKELIENEPGRYFFIDQFNNPSNVAAHYEETGRELVSQLRNHNLNDFKEIVLVKGIGSGASVTGIGRRLKETFDRVRIIAVEPEGYSLIERKFPDHVIEGIAVGVSPPLLDIGLIDEFTSVSSESCFEAQIWLARKYGIYPGLSSGANLAVARVLANSHPDSLIVTVIYDLGESYIRSGE